MKPATVVTWTQSKFISPLNLDPPTNLNFYRLLKLMGKFVDPP